MQLVLRAEALEELRFFFAFGGLQALDVTAPNLLLLKLELAIGLRVARITAPRLQEISMFSSIPATPWTLMCMAWQAFVVSESFIYTCTGSTVTRRTIAFGS